MYVYLKNNPAKKQHSLRLFLKMVAPTRKDEEQQQQDA